MDHTIPDVEHVFQLVIPVYDEKVCFLKIIQMLFYNLKPCMGLIG